MRVSDIVLLMGLAFALGYILGDQIASFNELDWCVEKAIRLLEIKGYDVEINQAAITMGLQLYRQKFDNFVNGTGV